MAASFGVPGEYRRESASSSLSLTAWLAQRASTNNIASMAV
ncbi:hypothetical protein A2U01_0113388 [Trifolium medium]|uniref:Uncharacterized protein n=1 Tax=Trifolium medium TaxID=97028 RepID=A0A392VX99_9FABA|nr:hypothetical protein [Trifolium medium]